MSSRSPPGLQGVGVCAGMWRAEGLRLGVAGVRRGHDGGREGNVPSGTGSCSVILSVTHTYTWPHAKCLPVTT